MRRFSFVAMILVAFSPLVVACDDDDATEPEGPYDLTFEADASFQGAHGGQDVTIAVVDQASGQVVAEDAGTVSADADPSFEFSFPGVLEDGASYYIDFWIDSNFNGGEVGTCDAPEIDHQWRLSIGPVSGDVNHEESHRPGDVESVCATFD